MASARGNSAGMQRSDSLGDIVAPPLQQQADQAAGQGSDQRADQAASAIWQWFRLLVERLAALVPWDDLWRAVLARVLDSDGQVGLLNMVDGRRTEAREPRTIAQLGLVNWARHSGRFLLVQCGLVNHVSFEDPPEEDPGGGPGESV